MLVPSTMAQSLGDLFAGRPLVNGQPNLPANAQAAGANWAQIYGSYAAAALAGTTSPLSPAMQAAGSVLGADLGDAFGTAAAATNAQMPLALLPSIDAAFVTFWTGMAFAGPGFAGLVTLVPPSVLAGALATIFAEGNPPSGPAPTADAQAQAIAGALDAWTKTVTVTNTPTGPGPPVVVMLT